MGLHQAKKFLHSTGNRQQNKKAASRMTETIYTSIWQKVNIQTVNNKKQETQQHQNNNPVKK